MTDYTQQKDTNKKDFSKKDKLLKIPVECYSRVCGYFRPISQWHAGKQEEFKDRKTYGVGNKDQGE